MAVLFLLRRQTFKFHMKYACMISEKGLIYKINILLIGKSLKEAEQLTNFVQKALIQLTNNQ